MKKIITYLVFTIIATLPINAQNFVNGNFDQGLHRDGHHGPKVGLD